MTYYPHNYCIYTLECVLRDDGGYTMSEHTRLRVGHCCPDAPAVDIQLDNTTVFEAAEFKTMTEYADIDSGPHQIKVMPHGETNPVLESTIDAESETDYTVLAIGTLSDLQPMVLSEDPGSIATGNAKVRCVHASPDAPSVDIMTEEGQTLFHDLGFREAGNYTEVEAGTWSLNIKPSGSDETVLNIDNLELEDQSAYTAVAVGEVADQSLDVMIAEDRHQMVPADD